jgi:hypothetical protein
MPELTITSPYVHSRVDSNKFTMGIGHWAMGNPMPETTLTLCQSRLNSGNMDLAYELGRVYTEAEEMSKNYQAANSSSPEVELRFCL